MRDLIEVVEAAYRPGADEMSWLGSVVEAARPLLDTGFGMAGLTYDASREDWIKPRQLVTPGMDPALAGSLFNAPYAHEEAARTFVRIFRTNTAGSAFAAERRLHPTLAEYYRGVAERTRLSDLCFVNATDPSHHGCMLVILVKSRKGPGPRAMHRWRRVAAHIAAGLRVHRRFSSAIDPASAEAILRADGHVEHAEAPAQGKAARRALAQGLIARDKAKGPLRREDQDGALSIWEGLIAGRWSLIDHVDTDGRRFVLARRNDPDAPDIRGLTLRERQVLSYVAQGHANKLIAYQLGLSTSAVAAHLTRAREKLRLRSMDAIRSVIRDVGTDKPAAG